MTDEPMTGPTNEPTEPVNVPADPATAPTEPVSIPADPAPGAGTTGPPPWQPAPEAAPAVAAAGAPPQPPKRSHVLVPVWALITVAGVLVFGLGLLGGWAIASHDDDSHQAISSQDIRGLAPFGGQNGAAGNGQDGDRWSTGNGSANGNSNGSNGDNSNGNGTANGNGSGNSQSANVYLGVVPKNSTDPAGAAIVEVAPGSPADKANFENGDVITAIDTNVVRNANQLVTQVRKHSSGDQVSVTYTRNGSSKTVKVTLASRPSIGQIPLPDQTPESQS